MPRELISFHWGLRSFSGLIVSSHPGWVGVGKCRSRGALNLPCCSLTGWHKHLSAAQTNFQRPHFPVFSYVSGLYAHALFTHFRTRFNVTSNLPGRGGTICLPPPKLNSKEQLPIPPIPSCVCTVYYWSVCVHSAPTRRSVRASDRARGPRVEYDGLGAVGAVRDALPARPLHLRPAVGVEQLREGLLHGGGRAAGHRDGRGAEGGGELRLLPGLPAVPLPRWRHRLRPRHATPQHAPRRVPRQDGEPLLRDTLAQGNGDDDDDDDDDGNDYDDDDDDDDDDNNTIFEFI